MRVTGADATAWPSVDTTRAVITNEPAGSGSFVHDTL
jgi:hypothetical protein